MNDEMNEPTNEPSAEPSAEPVAAPLPEYRRGEPFARYVRTLNDQQVKLVASEDGVITIGTELERQLADQLGLPATQLPKMSAKEVAALQKAAAEKEAD